MSFEPFSQLVIDAQPQVAHTLRSVGCYLTAFLDISEYVPIS